MRGAKLMEHSRVLDGQIKQVKQGQQPYQVTTTLKRFVHV